MRILILGGTGAIGSSVCKQLAEYENCEVFVTSRVSHESHNRIYFIKGDALNDITTILNSEYDVIIDFMSYSTNAFASRIKFLLDHTKHYIFISSSRVFAKSELPIKSCSDRLLNTINDQKYLQTDEYALTKARQEDMLVQSGVRNYTIIRPYITYNKNRLQLGVMEKEEWLYRLLHGRTILLPFEMMDRKTTMTSSEDVARFIVSIIGRTDAQGKKFNVTSSDVRTWKELLEIYSNTIKKKLCLDVKVKYLSTEDYLNCIGCSRKYQLIYDRYYDRVFDTSEIVNYIDINSCVSPEQGLSECVSSFLETPKFKNIKWNFEIEKDKLTKEIAHPNELPGFKLKAKYYYNRFK